jgi:hypothetical protein
MEVQVALANLFMTTTSADSPLDGSGGAATKPAVSDFLTVQAFANFAAMTGGISAAWHALERLAPFFSSLWVPYLSAFAFGVISFLLSLEGLRAGGSPKIAPGHLWGALFIAVINALVLASAVVGTDVAVRAAQ